MMDAMNEFIQESGMNQAMCKIEVHVSQNRDSQAPEDQLYYIIAGREVLVDP
jgi:hypothetical protein